MSVKWQCSGDKKPILCTQSHIMKYLQLSRRQQGCHITLEYQSIFVAIPLVCVSQTRYLWKDCHGNQQTFITQMLPSQGFVLHQGLSSVSLSEIWEVQWSICVNIAWCGSDYMDRAVTANFIIIEMWLRFEKKINKNMCQKIFLIVTVIFLSKWIYYRFFNEIVPSYSKF